MGERTAYRVMQPQGFLEYSYTDRKTKKVVEVRTKKDIVSPLLRQQSYEGGDKEDIERIVLKVAKTLMDSSYYRYTVREYEEYVAEKAKLLAEGKTKEAAELWKREKPEPAKINDGSLALRYDLHYDRLFPAMIVALYQAPFNSIETDINCDINNHGIYEIELETWNHWKVNHYDVISTIVEGETKKGERTVKFLPDRLGEKVTLCEAHFWPGLTLEDGVTFTWYHPREYDAYTEEYDNMPYETISKLSREETEALEAKHLVSKGYKGKTYITLTPEEYKAQQAAEKAANEAAKRRKLGIITLTPVA